MNVRMNERMNKQRNERTYEWTNEWTNKQTNKQTNEWRKSGTNEWTNKQTNVRRNRSMEWQYKQTNRHKRQHAAQKGGYFHYYILKKYPLFSVTVIFTGSRRVSWLVFRRRSNYTLLLFPSRGEVSGHIYIMHIMPLRLRRDWKDISEILRKCFLWKKISTFLKILREGKCRKTEKYRSTIITLSIYQCKDGKLCETDRFWVSSTVGQQCVFTSNFIKFDWVSLIFVNFSKLMSHHWRWTDGWTDGRMDGWMYGWKDGEWMDEPNDQLTEWWTNGPTDG